MTDLNSNKCPTATKVNPCPKCEKTIRCRIAPDGFKPRQSIKSAAGAIESMHIPGDVSEYTCHDASGAVPDAQLAIDDPLPLPAGLPPVMPFDYSMLPESLHGWIADISERMQCPPDFCAATALVMCGSLIGRQLAIRPKHEDDFTVVPNLYGILIGRASLMKSPPMKEVLKPLEKMEAQAAEKHASEMGTFGASEMVFDAKKKQAKAAIGEAVKSGGDALAIAKKVTNDILKKPIRRRYKVTDTTVEKLGEILADNPNGVMLCMDELVALFKSMERDGHESDRGFYLNAWSGDGRYTYDRIGRGNIEIEAATVSIIGTTQPGVYSDLLRAAVKGGGGDDGLIQRFQIAVHPDNPDDWNYVDRKPCRESRERAWAAIEKLKTLEMNQLQLQRDEYKPEGIPFLRFAPDTQAAFKDWFVDLHRETMPNAGHPALVSHFGKYRSLMPSIALIVHLLDGGDGEVCMEAAEKAIRWCEYLASHARRIYAGVMQSDSLAAHALAGHIAAGDVESESPFTARDIYRRGWTGLDRENTDAALELLLSCNWILAKDEPSATKPKTSYTISPKIMAMTPDDLMALAANKPKNI